MSRCTIVVLAPTAILLTGIRPPSVRLSIPSQSTWRMHVRSSAAFPFPAASILPITSAPYILWLFSAVCVFTILPVPVSISCIATVVVPISTATAYSPG